MMSPGLIERILNRAAAAMGMTPMEYRQHQHARMAKLNQELNEQLDSQRMTPEILNKRCTL
jgi:hypothetical protein